MRYSNSAMKLAALTLCLAACDAFQHLRPVARAPVALHGKTRVRDTVTLHGKTRGDGTEQPAEDDGPLDIDAAIDDARSGDVLVIAGKGHEDYQIIGTERTEFDDRRIASAALARRGVSS